MKKLIQFIKEAKIEIIERTTWPNKDDVLNSTIVVIVSIAVISAGLGILDLLLSKFTKQVIMGNINELREIIKPSTFAISAGAAVIIIYLYNRIKKRLKQ